MCTRSAFIVTVFSVEIIFFFMRPGYNDINDMNIFAYKNRKQLYLNFCFKENEISFTNLE